MANKWLDEVGQAIPKPLVPLARHVQSIWMPIPTGVGEWEVGCHVDEQHPEGRLSVTELVELLAFTIDDTPPAAKKTRLEPPQKQVHPGPCHCPLILTAQKQNPPPKPSQTPE